MSRTAPSGNQLRRLVVLSVVLVVVAVFIIFTIVRLRRESGSSVVENGAVAATNPLAPVFCLPESFEDNLAATAHVGGTSQREHATDGERSYKVTFSVLGRDGMSCRAGSLETTLTAGDRWVVDVYNPLAPFPVALVLSDGRGRNPVFLRNVPVPIGRSTLEFPLGYVERETDRLPLDTVKTFVLTYSLKNLERRLEVYLDAMRLEPEGWVGEAAPVELAPLPRDPDNFFPDGDFDLGFSAWRPRAYPGGHYRIAILTGVGAYRDGPSVGIYRLTTGSAGIASADLALESGDYALRFAVRGTGTVEYVVLIEEFRHGQWARRHSGGLELADAPAAWTVVEQTLSISAGEPAPRLVRIEIDARGDGDLFLDALRLVALCGASPEPERFDVDGDVAQTVTATPPATVQERLSWNGESFTRAGRPVHPVLFRQDDLPLDDDTRMFHQGCRKLGLGAAVDLGGAFHGGGPGTVLRRARRRMGDDGVLLWLLCSDVNWSLAGVGPETARHAARLLGEEDSRLVATGVGAHDDALVAYNFAGAADVMVVGGPLPRDPSVNALKRYDDVLAAAVRATAGTQPLVAQIDVRSSLVTLELVAHLAWIHGVDGLLLSRFQRQAPGWRSGRSVDWGTLGTFVANLRKRAGEVAGLRPASLRVGVDGPVEYRVARTATGRTVVIAVNLSGRRVDDVTLDVEGTIERITLGPWEAVLRPVQRPGSP